MSNYKQILSGFKGLKFRFLALVWLASSPQKHLSLTALSAVAPFEPPGELSVQSQCTSFF